MSSFCIYISLTPVLLSYWFSELDSNKFVDFLVFTAEKDVSYYNELLTTPEFLWWIILAIILFVLNPPSMSVPRLGIYCESSFSLFGECYSVFFIAVFNYIYIKNMIKPLYIMNLIKSHRLLSYYYYLIRYIWKWSYFKTIILWPNINIII